MKFTGAEAMAAARAVPKELPWDLDPDTRKRWTKAALVGFLKIAKARAPAGSKNSIHTNPKASFHPSFAASLAL